MNQPVIFASDIQSLVGHDETILIANMCQGRLVLEIGADTGRLTIAIASQAQRVHALDAPVSQSFTGDTLDQLVKNVKRYRTLDRTFFHIGDIETGFMLMPKDVFHVTVFSSERALRSVMCGRPDTLFSRIVSNKSMAVIPKAIARSMESEIKLFADQREVETKAIRETLTIGVRRVAVKAG